MIIALVGRMGSGKTFEAVNYHIVNAIKNGRRVVTNIPLNRPLFAGLYGLHVLDLLIVLEPHVREDGSIYNPFDQISDYSSTWFSDYEGIGTLFVIDELHLYMPSERNDLSRQALALATMQRHRGEDWIIITQNIDNIYKPIARLVSFMHYFESNSALTGFLGARYKHFVYNDIVRSKMARIKANPLKRFNKDGFALYKSHTQSRGKVTERNIEQTRVNLFNYLFLMVAMTCSLIYFIYNMYSNFDDAPPPDSDFIAEASTINDSAVTPIIAEPKSVIPADKPKINMTQVNENDVLSQKEADYNFDSFTVTKKTIIETDGDKSNIVKTVLPVEITEIERKKIRSIKDYKKAPFEGYVIQIFGNVIYNDYQSYIYHVYDQSGAFIDVKEKDLLLMGYSVVKVTDCVQLLDHANINNPFYITCHLPTFESKEEPKEKDKGRDKEATVKAEKPQVKLQNPLNNILPN